MEVPLLINRLLSGLIIFRIKSDTIFVPSPSVEVKTCADFIAYEAYQDAILSGVYTKETLDQMLVDDGMWSPEDEKKLKCLYQDIDQMKLTYFKQFFRGKREQIKERIISTIDECERMTSKQNVYFDKSAEYIRDFSYLSTIIERTATINGELASSKYNTSTLIFGFLEVSHIKNEKLRNVSKSSDWRMRWVCSGTNMFHNRVCDLNHEQISTVSWSKFYDNVYESTERPTEAIINDNFAIDGWAIEQQSKYNSETKVEIAGDNKKGDLFLPATSREDIRRVTDLNSDTAKKKMAGIFKEVNEHGSIDESQLSHVRKQIKGMRK